jgi:hypothetical protein
MQLAVNNGILNFSDLFIDKRILHEIIPNPEDKNGMLTTG